MGPRANVILYCTPRMLMMPGAGLLWVAFESQSTARSPPGQSFDATSRGIITCVNGPAGAVVRMNVDSIGVWTVQWADALPGAILLLLGAVTLLASAAHGWGVSSSDSHSSPLPRLSPVLIARNEPHARRCRGHS